MYEIFKEDAKSLLMRLPDESINLIVTDPPYASLDKHRAIGTTTRLHADKGSGAWFPTVPNRYFDAWFAEAYRVLADDAHLYFFCDQETAFGTLSGEDRAGNVLGDEGVVVRGRAAGFTFWKALIWDKQTMGLGYHYRARHEFILFFEKGKKKLTDLGVPDVLSFPRPKPSQAKYPTEKPVDLLRVLVRMSSSPGDVVLDTFMGSGSTGIAALLEDRHFIGCDVQDTAMELARSHLEGRLDERNFNTTGND